MNNYDQWSEMERTPGVDHGENDERRSDTYLHQLAAVENVHFSKYSAAS